LRTVVFSAVLLSAAALAQDTAQDFPDGAFYQRPEADGLLQVVFASHLAFVDEPRLCCGAQVDGAAYRFALFRSFDPTIIIRLERAPSDEWLLHTKTVDGNPNREKRVDPTAVVRQATEEEAETLLDAFERADFWRLPSKDPRASGLDGSHWVIEARIGDQYHYAVRWSPEASPVREIGEVFLEQSGVDFGAIY